MQTETKLKRIAWLSKQDPEKTFNSVIHHVNLETLTDSFNSLDKSKAVGTDGVSKTEYGLNLKENLEDLTERMKRMAYRPAAVREVLIPKERQPGEFRPLGIGNFEDKVVQGVFKRILESVYEPIFLPCSHGFRPGKSCHTAIKALHQHLFRQEVEMVIDLDLANFFGTIDHKLLEEILREKIKDDRFIRYIIRMFKAGVLSEGELKTSGDGVPQGSLCSPILANIFAHRVLDEWVEEMIQPYCRGEVRLFRYADDGIICCRYASDAKRVRETLSKRLEKYSLKLNEEKTKMVSFSKAQMGLGVQQGVFDFLGFTFYLGRSKSGKVIHKLKTSGKTMRNKLKRVGEWMKANRSKTKLPKLWKSLCTKLRGHVQYYGVSFNYETVNKFLYKTTRICFKWLNRRSQKKSLTWEKFNRFVEANPLPENKVYHPLF